MGFRFRKSINLGGGFRVNISKSGIGYSWGVKGYRITKTANGRTRRTTSIPGTGISHVTEKSNGKQRKRSTNVPPSERIFEGQAIENANVSQLHSSEAEELIKKINVSLFANTTTTIFIVVFLLLSFSMFVFIPLSIIAIAAKIYIRTKGIVKIEYEIDDDQQNTIEERMKPMRHLTSCDKVWRVVKSKHNSNTKYSGGSSESVQRVACRVFNKAPFPISSNVDPVCIASKNETLVFLPDKLFIIQKGKVGAITYDEIESSAQYIRFIESESVPKDSQIVGTTWKYVNKSGGPDKRFKDNKELPICLYGELKLISNSGLNTYILFSNAKVC